MSLPAAAATQKTGSGISISPTLSQFTIKPGQSASLSITLKNITVDDIIAQAAIYDFRSDNSTGNPQIITNPSQVSPNSVKPFVVGLSDVPLQLGQQKTINLSLQAPKDIPPGAYYGIIRYKAEPAVPNSPKADQVALSASVGTIVLITVPGNLRDQIQLTRLHIYHGGYDGSLFFSKPGTAGVEVKNLGNGFAQPFGTVTLTNMSGKQVDSYQLNNTVPRGNILPGSSRTFTNPLTGISSIGRYTLTASVADGNGGNVIVLKKTFWYIPLWLAILILVIIALIVVVIFWRGRRYRVAVRRYRSKRR